MTEDQNPKAFQPRGVTMAARRAAERRLPRHAAVVATESVKPAAKVLQRRKARVSRRSKALPAFVAPQLATLSDSAVASSS